MKLTFLGTGAADWQQPTESGEFRRFTATLIDDALLIDGTETISDQIALLGSVRAMIYTHSHADHFSPSFLAALSPAAAFAEESWAGEYGLTPIAAGQAFSAAGFDILPVPANHSTARQGEQPLNFILCKGGIRLLYATDGAWLTNSAYHALKGGAPLDAAVFDGTIGDDYPDDWRVFEHNSLSMVRQMRASLEKMGLLRPAAPVFVTHLARTLNPCQAELARREQRLSHPLIICYDGMSAEI